ncbi:MAG: hypothetical protein HN350_10435 [Phycisphaerales bacterium]|nr:hypothetical protein [Phycisphaerales bacterium]
MNDLSAWASVRPIISKLLLCKLIFFMTLVGVTLVSVCLFPGCGPGNSSDAAQRSGDSAVPSTGGDAEATAGKKILLVHSYHTGYPWVDGITRGLRMSLSGSDVELQIYYMDTKRQTSDEWKEQAGRRARELVKEWKPDVVIAADDNAQKYFVSTFLSNPDAPQFVFCGVNAEPAEYGYPAPNVTGILERPHFAASFDMLSKIQPGVKRIAFITDNSPTSKGVIAHLRTLKLKYEVMSIDTPDTFAQWRAIVEQREATADALAVFNYHTVQQSPGGQRVPPSDVMKWTAEHCRVPIVGFQVFTVDDGALCGYLESAVEHGMKAGGMALKILQGTPAGDIPMITALEGQSMLNLITARRLGISIRPELISQTDVTIGE